MLSKPVEHYWLSLTNSSIRRFKGTTPCTNNKGYIIQGNVASEAISTNSFKHNLIKIDYNKVEI